MEVAHCSLVTTIRRGVACSLAVATFLGATAAFGQALTPEVTAPIQEFNRARRAIEEKADADTAKEIERLKKNLERIRKSGNGKSNAGKQAAGILDKLQSPIFIAWGIDALTDDALLAMPMRRAEQISDAYRQRKVTAEDWDGLPGEQFKVTLKAPAGLDTGIEVQPGDVLLACPHPTQTWRREPIDSETTFDGRIPGEERYNGRQQIAVKIHMDGERTQVFVLKDGVLIRCTEKGKLFLHSTGLGGNSKGSIECKVFKITTR